ncbi:WD40/YVTN/BNR-like repeat-containing protein [Candidatus Omnitrophota bacterium]
MKVATKKNPLQISPKKNPIISDKPLIFAVTILSSILIFYSTSIANGFAGKVWQEFSDGVQERKVNCVAVDPHDADSVYIGTKKAVYKTEDGGKAWKSVLRIRGESAEVNFIRLTADAIYVAAGSGLFRSIDQGENWQRLFNGMGKLSHQSLCIAASLDNTLYLGTKSGLIISKDNGRTWHNALGFSKDSIVQFIEAVDSRIYAATNKGLFSTDNDGKSWERIYVASKQESNGVAENGDGFQAAASSLTQVTVDQGNHDAVYFSSNNGIFMSLNQGQTWKRVNTQGLISKKIDSFEILSSNHLLAATDKGAFEFDGKRWQQLYQGMITQKVNFITSDSRGIFWAATDMGVYRLQETEDHSSDSMHYSEDAQNNFYNEPSIQEIQKIAIEYAEVRPGKIQQWRKAAAKRAWLPKMSIGADRDNNKTVSDSIWGSYSSGGQHHVGPDDKTYYNNLGWDVSLTWDFGDLIWNDAQTSIDSRSKLMVELREDILDEVTRLYFERRRLQIELAAATDPAPSQRLDSELRLQELTALIDALTGGYLTRSLQRTN